MVHITKPIIKWVGGKTQIIDTLLSKFPTNIDNYHEIFLGGGSVLFALLSYIKEGVITVNGNIYAYDINDALINLYKNIQSNHIELYDNIIILLNEYNKCPDKCNNINRKADNALEASKCKENYYYWTRMNYNKLTKEEKISCKGSALFIFLNKTCFRGIFREGPNGFNVPYGNYKNVEIVNKDHLEEIHNLIRNVIFTCNNMSESLILEKIKSNDFVYLDPPYAPENSTSFVGYTKDGFTLEQHNNLFNICDLLSQEGKKIMMSNSNTELVQKHFNKYHYNNTIILSYNSI